MDIRKSLSKCHSALFPFIEAVLNARHGIALARGGIGSLVGALVTMIEQHGGKVSTEQRVEQILVNRGHAVGVRLKNGNKLYAKRAVVANVTPTQLVEHLLDTEDLPGWYVNKARSYRYGPGTMMIHLALSELLEWRAGEEFSRFAYVHVDGEVDNLARTYTQALSGALPDKPMLVVGQPTAVDGTRAAQGKHILWVQVRTVPAAPRYGTSDGQVHRGSWRQIKESYADRIIEQIAVHAPNIKDVILGRTVLSPTDLERDNPNLAGGDSVAGSHHIDQNYFLRPFAGGARYNTPIKRLHIIGAATWPGGGLNATSGYLLARKLL